MQYVVSVYLVPGQPGAFYQFGTSRDIAAAFAGATCARIAAEGRNFNLEDEDGRIIVTVIDPPRTAAGPTTVEVR
jgi:hypothetical protein